MEQLAHFVSKAFEEKEVEESEESERAQEEDLEKIKNSPTDLTQRNISPKPPTDRVSPNKSEAEKKENLKNVVDGLTNSQRRIMENLYQKLDFRNALINKNQSEDSPKNNAEGGGISPTTEQDVKNKTCHKTNAMDIANLIGEQKNSKRMDFNFLGAKDRLHLTLENSVNGLNESKPMESPTSDFIRSQKQHSRGSSASPIIDPEDSRSSMGSGPKKEPQDSIKGRIFIGNEDDSKTGKNKSYKNQNGVLSNQKQGAR